MLSGGDGGFHPSNIQEYGYSTGALNWTGDEAVLLPFDSPTFGGFLSCLVVIRAEWWKMGQLRPGSTVRFRRVSFDDAIAVRQELDRFLFAVQDSISRQDTISVPFPRSLEASKRTWSDSNNDEVIFNRPLERGKPEMTFRQV